MEITLTGEQRQAQEERQRQAAQFTLTAGEKREALADALEQKKGVYVLFGYE